MRIKLLSFCVGVLICLLVLPMVVHGRVASEPLTVDVPTTTTIEYVGESPEAHTGAVVASVEVEPVYLGEFKLTAYCSCEKCCGKWSKYNKTASGTTPEAGRTIAVDKDVIALGSEVVIDGKTYTAEDTGSKVDGNTIDVYHTSHKKALDFGVQYADVYLMEG